MLEVLNSDYVRLARAKGLRSAPGADPARAAHRADPADHGHRPGHRGAARWRDRDRDGVPVARAWAGSCSILVVSGDRCRRVMGVAAGHRRLIVIIGNIVADLLYGVLDPRIRYE